MKEELFWITGTLQECFVSQSAEDLCLWLQNVAPAIYLVDAKF